MRSKTPGHFMAENFRPAKLYFVSYSQEQQLYFRKFERR
jgi:hypothetical protein